MALAVILPNPGRTTIGAIELSASIREAHTQDAEITTYPVERGSDLSDNVRVKPATLVLEGIISDAAMKSEARIGSDGVVTRENPPYLGLLVEESYSVLLKMATDKDTFRVVTSIRVYENMKFSHLEITRDKNTGMGLGLVAHMQTIEFATAESAPRTDKPNQKQVKKGPVATKKAPPGAQKSTLFKAGQLFNENPGEGFLNFLNGGTGL